MTVTVPLAGLSCCAMKLRLSGRACRRLRYSPTVHRSRREDISEGRYSSRCKYTKYRHDVYIRSFVRVSPRGGALVYLADSDDGPIRKPLRAPRGYRWKIDQNGLALQSKSVKSADYHPDAGDLLAGVSHVRTRLHDLRKERYASRVAEARAKRLTSEINAAYPFPALHINGGELAARVTMQDSRIAGNCMVGTANFARRLGVDPDYYYASLPGNVLLRTGNDRAMAAARVASLRENCPMI